MQLLPLFSSLLAALSVSTYVTAAPGTSLEEPKIALSKRNNLLKRDSDEVDLDKVSTHLNRVAAKYQNSLSSLLANTGLDLTKDIALLQGVSKLAIPIQKRAGKTGSVSLATDSTLWHGAISYGGQRFQIDFDTGSADTIVNPDAYHPGSSAKASGQFTTQYGDGTTSEGQVYTDTVQVGGLSAPDAGIGRSNTAFTEPNEPDSGVAGMAFQSISSTKTAPFFDALIKAKALAKNVFTFTLSQGTSSLYLGGTGPANNPTYVNTDTSQGFWLTPDSTIAGQKIGLIHDTGTTLTIVPVRVAQGLFASLNVQTYQSGQELHATYDCNSSPKVTVKINGFSKDYSSQSLTFGKRQGQCVMSIVGMDINAPGGIAGDSFLQSESHHWRFGDVDLDRG